MRNILSISLIFLFIVACEDDNPVVQKNATKIELDSIRKISYLSIEYSNIQIIGFYKMNLI